MPSVFTSFMGRLLNKKDSDQPDQGRVQNTDISTDWARFQQNVGLLNPYQSSFPAFGVQFPASLTDGSSASDDPAANAVALDGLCNRMSGNSEAACSRILVFPFDISFVIGSPLVVDFDQHGADQSG